MADKKYFEFLDIPDGSGGSDRWHARDAEAQAGIAQVASAIGVDTDYEFVDLGLPSGTLWAKCNIGAESETDYGNYYMYGKGDRQYNGSDSAYTGTENPLDPTKDTATVILGAPWHMPTKEQFQELIANTTYSWQTNFNGSGINGGKFTAANGNYVFFSAAGYWYDGKQSSVGGYGRYWSSTPYNSGNAYYFSLSGVMGNINSDYRSRGFSLRPVCDTAPLIKVSSKADKATTLEGYGIEDAYTKSEVNDIAGSIADGAQAAELFTLRVDPDTMQLKALSTMANLNAFKMDEDGYLKIDLTATSE